MEIPESLKNRTIAITGANGYIGTRLRQFFKHNAIDVISVSRQAHQPDRDSNYIQADISDLECWLELVTKADIIFHLAGNTSVPVADSNPGLDLESTVQPMVHLIAAARKLGRKPRVVFSSTATVYGLTPVDPTTELMSPNPVTFYDLHKLFVEQQLAFATALGILEGISLRLTNVYGPSPGHSSSDSRGILNKVTALALEGKPLSVYGSGEYIRDYIFIDDVVDAFLRAAVCDRVKGQALNIGSGKGVTVRDAFLTVVAEVEKQTKIKVDIKTVPWPQNPDEIEMRNFVASIQKASSLLGWKPAISLNDGIRKLVSVNLEGFGDD
ncbi:MAG: NAD-dependent epimerase/dehydratase family protein [Gammaproteobacteria bacterium]|nr:NAD-dependent epimerase/dehydratase family protein [Gammaproteobacteria bacterium]